MLGLPMIKTRGRKLTPPVVARQAFSIWIASAANRIALAAIRSNGRSIRRAPRTSSAPTMILDVRNSAANVITIRATTVARAIRCLVLRSWRTALTLN
jgi:hypothetical protein